MEKYPKSYDVVVIGCGPAGASAGKFAAENGASTLIIEKKERSWSACIRFDSCNLRPVRIGGIRRV